MQMPPGSAKLSSRAAMFTVAENVLLVVDDVAEIDANAKLDSLVLRHAGIAFAHAALHLDRAAHRIHHARELHQRAVPGGLDDLAAMLLDLGVDQRPPVGLELGKRTRLVRAHEPAVASHVSGQDRRQPALGALLLHDGCLKPSSRRMSSLTGQGPQRCRSRRLRRRAAMPALGHCQDEKRIGEAADRLAAAIGVDRLLHKQSDRPAERNNTGCRRRTIYSWLSNRANSHRGSSSLEGRFCGNGAKNIPANCEPCFLADAATRRGMSGAPVFKRGRTLELEGDARAGHPGQGTILEEPRGLAFVGIYSGRLGKADLLEAQLGKVWYPSAIRDVVVSGIALDFEERSRPA
jgi:hypothetical protein